MVKNCIVASTVIFNRQGKVLLIRHKKFHTWIYPGGHVETNEHPDAAAKREAFEETGFRIRILDTLKRMHVADSSVHRIAHPMAVLFENVGYKAGSHKHFDLIYLAESIGRRLKSNHDSHVMGWFSENEIDDLGIKFRNVVQVIHEAFRVRKRLKEG